MIVKLDESKNYIKPEQEEGYFKLLMFESHKFVEYKESFYRCEFCGITHEGLPHLTSTICKQNPHLFPEIKENGKA